MRSTAAEELVGRVRALESAFVMECQSWQKKMEEMVNREAQLALNQISKDREIADLKTLLRELQQKYNSLVLQKMGPPK